MTGLSKQRTWSGVAPAVLSLVLLLTACQPSPPAPPSGPPFSPGTSGPPATAPASPPEASPAAPSSPTEPGSTTAPAAVHFTAQGDIGLGTGARKVLDTVNGLHPELNL